MKSKICKECGIEKPIGEIKRDRIVCKVCCWKNNNKHKYKIYDNWDLQEIDIVLDNILNRKIKFFNELVSILKNKTIDDITVLTGKHLRINTSNYGVKLIKKCEICSKDIITTPIKVVQGQNRFCSQKCNGDSKITRVNYECINCGKEFDLTLSHFKRSVNHFCSNECSHNYNSKKLINRVVLKCKYCNCDYEVAMHAKDISKFCSKECMDNWQASDENKGINNPKFNSILIDCDWCNKEYHVKPSKLHKESQQNYFCSAECRQDWFAKDYSQRKSFRDGRRKTAVEILENGFVNTVDTDIQIIINKILDSLGISYKNEKGFVYYSVDNFLTEYNLIIEVMGSYWHCDHRLYDFIKYERHLNRVRQDKAKRSYLKNNYDIEILYLWGSDIRNNTDLCRALILHYINSKGVLNNYHSFNYRLMDVNTNEIELKKQISNPYMEWDKDDLNKVINFDLKENMSKKQVDKWVTFNCDYCGKEKESLKSHYVKNKNHFCSRECMGKYQSIGRRVSFECSYCGTLTTRKLSAFKESKPNFCNRSCSATYYNLKRSGRLIKRE